MSLDSFCKILTARATAGELSVQDLLGLLDEDRQNADPEMLADSQYEFWEAKTACWLLRNPEVFAASVTGDLSLVVTEILTDHTYPSHPNGFSSETIQELAQFIPEESRKAVMRNIGINHFSWISRWADWATEFGGFSREEIRAVAIEQIEGSTFVGGIGENPIRAFFSECDGPNTSLWQYFDTPELFSEVLEIMLEKAPGELLMHHSELSAYAAVLQSGTNVASMNHWDIFPRSYEEEKEEEMDKLASAGRPILRDLFRRAVSMLEPCHIEQVWEMRVRTLPIESRLHIWGIAKRGNDLAKALRLATHLMLDLNPGEFSEERAEILEWMCSVMTFKNAPHVYRHILSAGVKGFVAFGDKSQVPNRNWDKVLRNRVRECGWAFVKVEANERTAYGRSECGNYDLVWELGYHKVDSEFAKKGDEIMVPRRLPPNLRCISFGQIYNGGERRYRFTPIKVQPVWMSWYEKFARLPEHP